MENIHLFLDPNFNKSTVKKKKKPLSNCGKVNIDWVLDDNKDFY